MPTTLRQVFGTFVSLRAHIPLAHDPRPVGVVQMTGVDAYRVRVGDYRIVYTIRDSVLLVTVIRVGHRREVYEDR